MRLDLSNPGCKVKRKGEGWRRGISVLAVACHHETNSLLVMNHTNPDKSLYKNNWMQVRKVGKHIIHNI